MLDVHLLNVIFFVFSYFRVFVINISFFPVLSVLSIYEVNNFNHLFGHDPFCTLVHHKGVGTHRFLVVALCQSDHSYLHRRIF